MLPISDNVKESIWCLIDVDDERQSELDHQNFKQRMFPVQVTSPNSKRYFGWVKQRGASIWVMPLWSDEEIPAGYVQYMPYSNLHSKADIVFVVCVYKRYMLTIIPHCRLFWKAEMHRRTFSLTFSTRPKNAEGFYPRIQGNLSRVCSTSNVA